MILNIDTGKLSNKQIRQFLLLAEEYDVNHWFDEEEPQP